MRFHTLVGILPHEAVHPQPLEMDITVWLTPQAESSQRGPARLDYRALYAAAESAVGAAPIGYLEDLVDRVAATAMALPAVDRVRVAARKPHVALPGFLEHAEVAVERERGA